MTKTHWIEFCVNDGELNSLKDILDFTVKHATFGSDLDKIAITTSALVILKHALDQPRREAKKT